MSYKNELYKEIANGKLSVKKYDDIMKKQLGNIDKNSKRNNQTKKKINIQLDTTKKIDFNRISDTINDIFTENSESEPVTQICANTKTVNDKIVLIESKIAQMEKSVSEIKDEIESIKNLQVNTTAMLEQLSKELNLAKSKIIRG